MFLISLVWNSFPTLLLVDEEGHGQGLARSHFELFFPEGQKKGQKQACLFATEFSLPRMIPGTWHPMNIIRLINEGPADRADSFTW